MPTKKKQSEGQNEVYFQVWRIEQEHSRTRWTVTTFFLSVSFAILGLSFDPKNYESGLNILGLSLPDVQRIIGVSVFWFGYFLFRQFDRYTQFLRSRLKEMEKQELVNYTFQSDARDFMHFKIRAAFTASRLLFYFGILYTGVVFVLWVFTKNVVP
jgi:protein-S-isoprenylcysteine O-methyltransferase Ste14